MLRLFSKPKWEAGRQNSGYDKILLLSTWKPFKFQFDVYLLRFPKGSKIDWHTDPVGSHLKHYRLNVFIKHARVGGHFELSKGIKPLFGASRIQLFRPDIHPHRVTEVLEGTRYVLSIGWVTGV